LLGPARLWRLERQRCCRGGRDLSIRVHENGFHTAGTDVETEKQSYRTPRSSSMVS
jgi:hypothetical protein